MEPYKKLRKQIQQILLESFSKSGDLVDENPIELKHENPEDVDVLGEPLETKLNSFSSKKLHDGNLVGVVGVKSGSKNVGKDFNSGKAKARFVTKKGAPKTKK